MISENQVNLVWVNFLEHEAKQRRSCYCGVKVLGAPSRMSMNQPPCMTRPALSFGVGCVPPLRPVSSITCPPSSAPPSNVFATASLQRDWPAPVVSVESRVIAECSQHRWNASFTAADCCPPSNASSHPSHRSTLASSETCSNILTASSRRS